MSASFGPSRGRGFVTPAHTQGAGVPLSGSPAKGNYVWLSWRT